MLEPDDLVEGAFNGERSTVKGADFDGSRIDSVGGATDLAGAVIDSTQMIPLALSLFGALGIVIDDGDRISD